MRLKYKLPVIVLALILLIHVPLSYAWLTTASNSVGNTFTVGHIQLQLQETTGNTYTMTPGVTVPKDPCVTVLAQSESCWLFVRLETAGDPDCFLTYSFAEGWLPLDGQPGVYYRTAERSDQDQAFPILADNRVTVKDTVTEEMLGALTENPTMTFYAYAIQQAQIATAEIAWQQLQDAQES